MMEYPGFGVLLARVLAHRELDIGALCRQAAVPEPELRGVLDGEVPSPPLLGRLAPAFGLHAADMFVLAGVPVPDELAPLDVEAGAWVPPLVGHALRLLPEQRQRLRKIVHSLPQEEPTEPVSALPAYEQFQPSMGALLVCMLRNRNLNWSRSAKVLSRLAGIHLAASTIGAIGHGRKELTPELLAGFATVLAISLDDLAALTGMELSDGTPSANLAVADVAQLIWDVRRLTLPCQRYLTTR
jgi:hypothetical protein